MVGSVATLRVVSVEMAVMLPVIVVCARGSGEDDQQYECDELGHGLVLLIRAVADYETIW
jgi:hypothetical protein